MKRVVAVLVTLVAALAGAAPASSAGPTDGIDWGVANWAAGVQMYVSEPSATDQHVHVRFKRVGGEGLRQVRMGEYYRTPGSHRWKHRYTKPVLLSVGEKVVFTTRHALPCEPAKQPLAVDVDMRIKPPGKPWKEWQTWVSSSWYILDCSE